MKVEVIAHPNSKKVKIKKDLNGTVHVYVNQVPTDGKANKEIIKVLAKFFGIRNNQVFLMSGEKSKKKIFEIKNKTLF